MAECIEALIKLNEDHCRRKAERLEVVMARRDLSQHNRGLPEVYTA